MGAPGARLGVRERGMIALVAAIKGVQEDRRLEINYTLDFGNFSGTVSGMDDP